MRHTSGNSGPRHSAWSLSWVDRTCPAMVGITSGWRHPIRAASISGGSGGHLRRPAVGLAFQLAAPAVERVVEHEAVPQHLVVVAEARPQTERDSEEPRRLWRQVEPLGIRTADDPGELV